MTTFSTTAYDNRILHRRALALPWRGLYLYDISMLTFRVAAGIVGVAILFYLYGIAVTVGDVITRAHYEKLSAALSDRVNTLEAQYLTRSASITPDFAAAQGYKEAQTTLFATADLPVDRFAFASHAIR